MIMTVLAYTLFFVGLFTVPRLRQDKTLFLIVSTTLLFNAIGMEWLYKALEQYTYITVRSIIFKFIALIAMFVLIHEKSDYVIYGGISIFAASASNVFNFVYYLPIIIGVLLGGAASVCVKSLCWMEFPALALSAILFFGVYALVLTLAKEPMTIGNAMQIENGRVLTEM